MGEVIRREKNGAVSAHDYADSSSPQVEPAAVCVRSEPAKPECDGSRNNTGDQHAFCCRWDCYTEHVPLGEG